jgi:GrpB-like predicted nucleotidyltransferase (UPF0157 family)
MQVLWDALLALVPPALVGLLFWVMLRGILRADSKEREAYAKMEAEMRAKAESEQASQKAK